DPLGLAPDSNPYRYVGNSPTNAVDPTGRYLIAANLSVAMFWQRTLKTFYGVDAHIIDLGSGRYQIYVPPDQWGKLEAAISAGAGVNPKWADLLIKGIKNEADIVLTTNVQTWGLVYAGVGVQGPDALTPAERDNIVWFMGAGAVGGGPRRPPIGSPSPAPVNPRPGRGGLPEEKPPSHGPFNKDNEGC